MKLKAAFVFALCLFVATPLLAQQPVVTGWQMSDIRTVTASEIAGKKAGKGTFLEYRAEFQIVSSDAAGAPRYTAGSLIALSAIRLTGYPGANKKPWAIDADAIGFESPEGCVSYQFLDSKGASSASRNVDGRNVELNIVKGKVSITPGIPVKLCLAFLAPEVPQRTVLFFSGTELSIQERFQPFYSQAIVLDEKTMSKMVIFNPDPAYPPLARIARVTGTVNLMVTIAQAGSVRDVFVVDQTNPLLLQGVVDTVRSWRYQPIAIGNSDLGVRAPVTLKFQLK